MKATLEGGAIKKFKRTPWRFERTYETPLRSLREFTSTILSAIGERPLGKIVIDSLAMESEPLEKLLLGFQLPKQLGHDRAISAETAEEVQPLLVAAFESWLDFLFVPTPAPFVTYADHDEYTTFFAHTKSNLNKAVRALDAKGFIPVENYRRLT